MEIKQLQLQLKVVWLKDFLGLAIDNVILDQSYSLTPYYFWPKTEVWEQLNLELNTKPWFLEKDKIKILNLIAEKSYARGDVNFIKILFSRVKLRNANEDSVPLRTLNKANLLVKQLK